MGKISPSAFLHICDCTSYILTEKGAPAYYRERTFFYDSKGRTVQVKETGSDGWTSRYSSSYDFTGNLISYVERHSYGSHEDYIKCAYQYDLRGRKTLARRWLNGREFTPMHYVYDDLGRKALVDCEGKVTELYSYNLQGWPKTQEVLLYGQPEAFQMSLRHYDSDDPQAEPVFGGFVSEAVSKHMGQDERTVIYRYDDLGRVIDATEVGGSTEAMEYDANGNVLSAGNGTGGSNTSRTLFTHSGNRLATIRENNRTTSFTYWPNGNLKTNLKENLSFSYNFSNLLTDVRKGVTQIATITYLADGTKVKVRAADGTALLYRGKFIYRAALNGLPTIESVEHDHGRFLPGNSANEFIDTWHVRDYLGSTRAIFDITPDYAEDLSEVILEQNDYCLFGSRIDNADLPTLAQNRYRFNGKEKLIAGANDTKLTDYGARMFSAPLARWTTPDPLADKYYSTSPYAFCNNNPVNFVDPDGKVVGTVIDIISVGVGVYNLVTNLNQGNTQAALDDLAGIGLDLVSAFVPGVTVAAGATKTLAKVANGAANVADAAKAVNVADNAVTAAKNTSKLQESAKIGQEAHRQIEADLKHADPRIRTEVTIKLDKKKDCKKRHPQANWNSWDYQA